MWRAYRIDPPIPRSLGRGSLRAPAVARRDFEGDAPPGFSEPTPVLPQSRDLRRRARASRPARRRPREGRRTGGASRAHVPRAAFHRLAPLLRDPERLPEQRLRRGGAEGHEHLRLHERQLTVEPLPTGVDVLPPGLLVNPARAATRRAPAEVLDRVVTYTVERSMPACSSIWSSSPPAGPTNGRPARSSGRRAARRRA